MINKPLFLLVFVSFANVFAQQSFSLDEAISYALVHNPTAVNASLDKQIAEKKRWETIAGGLPQISVKGDYTRYIQQPISLIPAEIFGGEPGTFAQVAFGTAQRINASARVDQLIFNGSYLVGVQASKVYLEISDRAKIKTDIELQKQVTAAYANVLLATSQLEVLNNNIATLSQLTKQTQAMVESGFSEEEDLEQLQLTLNQLKNAQNYSERVAQISTKMLKLVMGMDLETPLKLSENLKDLWVLSADETTLNKTFDLEENIDYLIVKNDVESSRLLLRLERFKALPSLSAFASGGYDGNNNTFNFLEKNQAWFGSALVGVNLSIPVFSAFARTARTQQAKIELKKSRNNLNAAEQQLKLDFDAKKSDYEFTLEGAETAQLALELAQRIEEKNRIKYQEGLASSFDLLQAQNQLYNAQNNQIEAVIKLINAKAELETLQLNKNK